MLENIGKFKKVTEKDLNDGQEVLALYDSLDEEAKKQAKVYLSALSDRCNYVDGRIA